MSNLETKNNVGKEYSHSLAEAVLNSQTFRSSIHHMYSTEANRILCTKTVVCYIGCDNRLYFKCIGKNDWRIYNEELHRLAYITFPALKDMLPEEIFADLIVYINSFTKDFCNGSEDFAPFDLINGLSEVDK